MIKTLLQLTAVVATLSATALADYGDIRITSTPEKPTQGRLEFKDRNGAWSTICDNGFSGRAGDVACKQLGFLRAEKVLYNQFKSSHLPITICETSCTGKESRLVQCQLKSCNDSSLFQLPCENENVVGVHCTNSKPVGELNDDSQVEVGSGNGHINENGIPIDDDGGDDHDFIDDHKINDGDVSVGNVDNTQVENQDQDDSKPSDDSTSTGVIIAIVLSCLFLTAVILFTLGIVCLSYRRRRLTFIVTQDHPKILVASDTYTKTTSIPKSYMQSARFAPKGYEALPVTDYVPVQPDVKKPVY